MLQQGVAWDLYDYARPPLDFRLYVQFLFVAAVVVLHKLSRLWWLAPPFMRQRKLDDPSYRARLEMTGPSLKNWQLLIVLVTFAAVFDYVANQLRVFEIVRAIGISAAAGELAIALKMFEAGTFATIFLLLARWHVANRARGLQG